MAENVIKEEDKKEMAKSRIHRTTTGDDLIGVSLLPITAAVFPTKTAQRAKVYSTLGPTWVKTPWKQR
jgi:hypothetical protein